MPRVVPRSTTDLSSVALEATADAIAADVDTILARTLGLTMPSVQRGSITLSGVTTATATIVAVDTTRSVVVWLGDHGENTTGAADRARLTLTNATTVTATRVNAGAPPTVVEFEVWTFDTVVSLQQGTTVIGTTATSATTTITSVNRDRSIVIFGGQSVATADDRDMARVTLTNGTTVTASREGSGVSGDTTVAWAVVEF